MSTPPAVGKTLSVKVDQQLYDDLETMLGTGMTQSDAAREAITIIAEAFRAAWATGRVPKNVVPTITQFMISGYDADWLELTERRATSGTPRRPITPAGPIAPASRPTPVRHDPA